MDDEFKREYRKLTTDFGAEDESKSPQSGQSKPRVHKVVMSDLQLEELLISELGKVGVEPQTKVPVDRPYKYPSKINRTSIPKLKVRLPRRKHLIH